MSSAFDIFYEYIKFEKREIRKFELEVTKYNIFYL